MNAGTVRWGGITVFIGIALAFLFPFITVAVVGLQGLQPGAGGMGAALGEVKIMTMVMNFAMMVVMVFVFLSTKGYFNALSYHRADIPITIIIGVQIVWLVFSLILNTSGDLAGLMQAGNMRALGVVGIIVLVTMLAFFFSLLFFAVLCLGFGKIGGGLWKAVGILYLIALIGIIVSVIVIAVTAGLAAGAPGGAIAGMVMIALALLCYGAAVLCHGIGLILGAGRMERQYNPADVF